jgi:hypothetical protein
VVELAVTAGIWALGMFVLTVLVRVALPIELGEARSPHITDQRPQTIVRPRSNRPPRRDPRPVRTR